MRTLLFTFLTLVQVGGSECGLGDAGADSSVVVDWRKHERWRCHCRPHHRGSQQEAVWCCPAELWGTSATSAVVL